MKFWAAAKSVGPAYSGLTRSRLAVTNFLDDALGTSSLAGLDAEIRYVPIVVPADRRDASRARSRLHKKDKVYDCCPQLNYDLFISGSFADQVREYLRGLETAPAQIARLGATPDQVAEFEAILAGAADQILAQGEPPLPPPTSSDDFAEGSAEARRAMAEDPASATAELERTMKQLADADRARTGSTELSPAAAAMLRRGQHLLRALAAEAAAPPPSTPSQPPPQPPPPADLDPIDADDEPLGTPPALIAVDPDGFHIEHAGRTADGRQFLLLTPFAPAGAGTPGNEFVALYLFDPAGALIEARIDAFGPRATLDLDQRNQLYEQHLHELGPVSIERITIAPFAVERFGTTFGFIPRPPDFETVDVQPGDIFAFHAPWDSGEFDT